MARSHERTVTRNGFPRRWCSTSRCRGTSPRWKCHSVSWRSGKPHGKTNRYLCDKCARKWCSRYDVEFPKELSRLFEGA